MRPYFSGFWSLAVSLALGWAGSATATITLSVDKPLIREEDDRVEITVTAESDANVTKNTVVSLMLGATNFNLSGNPILPYGVGNLSPQPEYNMRIDDHGRFVSSDNWRRYSSAPGTNAPWWSFLSSNQYTGALQTTPTKPGGDWKDWFNSRA